VIDHNTMDFDGTTVLFAYGSSTSRPRTITGFQYTNNASPHGTYGVNGDDASTGTLTLQMYFPDVIFTGNWLSGGPASRYPAGNRFDDGFKLNLTSAAGAAGNGPGANLARLLPLLQAIPNGLMIGIPQSPRNLRIISPGK
jgi:hypothetical protein